MIIHVCLFKHSVLLQKEIWTSLSKLAKLCFDMQFVFDVKPYTKHLEQALQNARVYDSIVHTIFIIVIRKQIV